MAEKRPIFEARVSSEFGDVSPADMLNGVPEGFAGDTTYTPGFSEMRQQRDLEILEVKRGIRQGRDVLQLPVNVRLVRNSKPVSGRPDGTKVLKSGTKGYKPVTMEHVGSEWFKELPPGAEVMPDGTIRQGDTIWMYADAKTAARNQFAKDRATADMVNANDASTDGLFGVVGQHKGAAPSAKKIEGDLSKAKIFAD